RAPAAMTPSGDEALATLVRRYFGSHGPATIRDCAWWSGLRMADVNRGIEAARPRLHPVIVDGTTYWYAEWAEGPMRAPSAHLLPNYDEYLVAYAERSALLDPALGPRVDPRLIFSNVVLIRGRAVGTWRRQSGKDGISFRTELRRRLATTEKSAVRTAVR